ncbi:FAD-binding dehydrogenase [Saccharopolyspora sp. MS10]|uniref:FAD-binding dehydrogenase n=1 Tax=Saccharopolyspora sp. MS10 TaxID=3385973 RepID=UPI00399FD029
MAFDADVIVVGAGLAGLVATAELADSGRRVLLLDQEPESSLGGQAHWSFGGLFLVDSPEQRRLGVRDSAELAWQDWEGTAGFDRAEDRWPRRWAEAYVDFAAGEKRAWLREQGLRLFPAVQWAERGGSQATGHGNSVPRFHITWGTGPGVLEPFLRRVRAAEERGLVSTRFRHRVTGLTTTGGAVDGVRGEVLEPSPALRGQPSSRTATGEFSLRAQAVVVTSGGIGGNLDLVRRNWPARMGPAPRRMISGVPDHVDGKMLGIVADAGGSVINSDRMWHYTEGIQNYDPVWTRHGIRILPGPSSYWIDAEGRRLPPPLFPGADTLATLAHINASGHDHTWFVLNRRIISREFALSGSEQNPDLTGRSIGEVLRRGGEVTPGPVAEFVKRGADFVTRRTLPELVRGMNELTGSDSIDAERLERDITARDRQVTSGLGKDAQVGLIRAARRYSVDRWVRVTPPHRLLDPEAGPLVAVRLSLLTRKTLGGLETDLDARVLGADGSPLPGLYAAGEVAGFGGGGMHGYRSLEGTFLGGCLFSGRAAGRAAARATA